MKKTIKELTNEELLELANNQSSIEIVPEDPVMEFVKKFGIESGPNKVPLSFLKKFYKSTMLQTAPSNFKITLMGFLKSITNKHGIVFFINLDIEFISSHIKTDHGKKNMLSNVKNQNHFKAFLDAYKIDYGTRYVYATELFDNYTAWRKSKDPRFSPQTFNQFFDLLEFDKKITKYGIAYGINHSLRNTNDQNQTVPHKESSIKE